MTCKKERKPLSCVWFCETPCTVAHQAPPSMGFTRQEYWSGSWYVGGVKRTWWFKIYEIMILEGNTWEQNRRRRTKSNHITLATMHSGWSMPLTNRDIQNDALISSSWHSRLSVVFFAFLKIFLFHVDLKKTIPLGWVFLEGNIKNIHHSKPCA